MKKRRKWIIPTGIAAAVLLCVVMIVNVLGSGTAPASVGTVALTRMTLEDSISTKGIVESVNKRNVSSTLGFPVQTIFVQVGDRVTEGQPLCQLDTEDLSLSIAQQKADLDVTQQNSLNQLENNQRIYDEAVSNMEQGSNAQIINAESNFQTAKLNLDNAQRTYDDAVRDRDEGKTQGVMSAESNLAAAKLDMDNKKRDFEANRTLFETGAVSQDALTQSETAATNATNKYNDALESLEAAKLNEQRAIEQAESNLNTAKSNYNNASASLNAAKNTASQDLERYLSNVEGSEITANMDAKLIALQKLEKQLEDSTVTAPISGTVTAVFAKEGQPASGLLFVVEDTDNLLVKTKIKEYDAGKVSEGMPVTIRSDATGNEQYNGTVTKLNPAAEKNAQGDTNTTGDIEFGAEVSVDTQNTPLKVGMNTRLTIILASKENVYCVPYDAVSTNANGETVVYSVSESGKDTATARAIPVTTGMETDFYIEIESDQLTDGMRIINDSVTMVDGTQVRLSGGGPAGSGNTGLRLGMGMAN